jgi:hypothetical protein
MKLDLAKDLFRDSWARRDQLTGGVGTPIGIITAVGGVLALMAKGYTSGSEVRNTAFIVAVAEAVAFLIISAWFLARSYHGYEYDEIPNAVELDKFCRELHAYHAATGGAPEQADADFDEYLAARFVAAADKNSNNNTSKAAFLYRSVQTMLVAVVFAALAAAPWLVAQWSSKPTPLRVAVDAPLVVKLQPGQAYADTAPSVSSPRTTSAPSKPKSAAAPRRPTKSPD